MIPKIIGWWTKQPVIAKIFLGLFVGVLLIVVFVGSFLFRKRCGESSVLDTAVDLHEKQTIRRQEELQRRDEEGKKAIERSDKEIKRLMEEGHKASDNRERRDDELRNADSWDDLNDELGNAGEGGRSGTR